MKYFSMFSGIGGFELGIEKACDSDKQPSQVQQDGEGRDGAEAPGGPTRANRRH